MEPYTDKKKGKIDLLDEKILELLRLNSRFTNKAIATVVNVSEGTVRRRVKLLQRRKVISRFTIETTELKEAIILSKYDPNQKTAILEQLKKISHKVYEVAGKSDIAIMVSYWSLMELNEFIDRIREIKGIKNTETMIRLK
ncbi:MAG: AsnC family transcriptional regulator [Cuniculiplasma sp.]